MSGKQKKALIKIIISVLTSILYFVIPNKIISLIILGAGYITVGYDILRKAFKGILNKDLFNENFLMAVATIGAFIIGEFFEGVAVMIFYQIGELFQSVAVGKSRQNIAKLMDIAPVYANLITEDGIVKVSPDEVETGSVIIVNVGEKVPIDGIVIEGESYLDTVALTGEFVPREVKTGENVVSGCINSTASLKIKTTKKYEDSTVAKILDLVENQAMKKSKSENFITEFARVYTPVVCIIALILAIVPPFITYIIYGDAEIRTWVVRALTFLVISCPCALVISVPLGFFGGIGCASEKGILIKGSNYFETLTKVKHFVFDKTGTLTSGEFAVTDVCCGENFTEKEVLYYGALAESGSIHPVAESIKKAYGEEIDIKDVKSVKELAGHGVYATWEEKKIYAGNRKLMESFDIEIPEYFEEKSGTKVYVGIDKEFVGVIILDDKLKPDIHKTIFKLKKIANAKTYMLTGDTKEVAERIGADAGIETVHSSLLPHEKVKQLEKIIKSVSDGEKVAYIGDGINDSPVLARADVGIAMGGLGSDAAIEASDIVLMDDAPSKLIVAIKIAKKTLSCVKQNIIFSLGIKGICLILGALGLVGMGVAVFADVGVMVLAVLNSMRTLHYK